MGGARGRLISPSDRQEFIDLIKHACASGARLGSACRTLGIATRTYQRWVSSPNGIHDGRKGSKIKPPANKLCEQERREILFICNQKEFQSLPPSQIVPRLADEGQYIASESTFYRVLKEAKRKVSRETGQVLELN